MGWASGSELAEEVWELVRPLTTPGEHRTTIAKKLVELFEARDCDTIDEAEQLCEDAEG